MAQRKITAQNSEGYRSQKWVLVLGDECRESHVAEGDSDEHLHSLFLYKWLNTCLIIVKKYSIDSFIHLNKYGLLNFK